jgi:hydroxymethylglutaryl-CoA lyase
VSPSPPNSPAIRITDVSLRDGLQNESAHVPTAEKARLAAALWSAGVDELELTSFVSAKWIPQLGDADALCAAVAAFPPTPDAPLLSALVPNDKGLACLLKVNQAAGRRLIAKASVFTAASEAFTQRNINATIEQSLARFVPVITQAHAEGLLVRGYLSCVIACPFAGPIAPAQVAHVATRLADLGVDEIDLGDTIGSGRPDSIAAMLEAVLAALGPGWLTPQRCTLHLHDTFGQAAQCVRTALNMGIRSFDASVAGLGGCPYASQPGKPAPGNLATERLLETLAHAGMPCRTDPQAIARAADTARDILARARAQTPDRP